MRKGKPRHNPDKRQNQIYLYHGIDDCSYYDNLSLECFKGTPEQVKCKGNRHCCVKVEYHLMAIKKEYLK